MSTLSVRWIYVLDQDVVYNILSHLPAGWNQSCAFLDRKGRRRLEIHPNGDAKVIAGYDQDSCAPKFAVLDILIGIPVDVPNQRTKKPKTYCASLIHDVLYEFLAVNPAVSKALTDRIFLELLMREAFAPRHIYGLALVILERLNHLFTRWTRSYAGKQIPITRC